MNIDIPASVHGGRWPVTVGVPFPQGALPKTTTVSVLQDGKAISTQSTPLATWEKEGKSVRWLLLDFTVDAATARNSRYELKVLTGNAAIAAKRNVAASPLKLARDGDALVINTGAANFRLRTKGKIGLERVGVGGKALVTAEKPSRFSIANQDGKMFYASGDLTEGGFEIEDQGPQRIGLKSKGWYIAEDGSKFCQHVIRMEFFVNQPTVHVFHTMTFTETSDSAQISDLAIELPLAVGGARTGAFGIDAADFSKAQVLPNMSQAHLVQDYKTRWDLEWKLFNGESKEPMQTGERTGGWANLSTPNGGVTVALRDAWQNYPNEFEINEGKLIAHLWPRHGRQLDFRTKAQLEQYGAEGTEQIDKYLKSEWKKSIFEVYNNAMGLAKTHELWLDFRSGPRNPTRTTQIATQTNTPVLAQSTPEWNTASGAMGPMAAKNTAAYGEVEEMLDAMFDRFTYWQSHFADYGWVDFGDVHCSVRRDDFGVSVKGGKISPPYRYWDSAHYGLPNAPWIQYFRTGDRKYLEFAEQNTRHAMDIDRCHFGDGKVRIKGSHYYTDWSIIHWSGKPPEYVFIADYNRLEFMLYAYYMRGYRRGLDVMKDWGEAMSFYHNHPDESVDFPFRILKNQVVEHVRHFGPPLGNLLELYKVTWDERYRDIAKDYAKAVIKMSEIDNPDLTASEYSFESRYSFEARFCWEQFLDYANFSGDEKFKQAVEVIAKAAAHRGVDASWGDAAVMYALTGDLAYRDAGIARLSRLRSHMNISDEPKQRGTFGSWDAGHHPFAMRSIPFFLGVINQTPEKAINGSQPSAELPIMQTVSALHLAGPRLSPLYIKPVAGKKAEVLLNVGWGQKATLQAPDGKALRELETPKGTQRLHRLELEPSTGTYTVKSDLRPIRGPSEYEDRGNLELLNTHNAKVVAGASTSDGLFNVFAPRLYFFVPQTMAELSIEVDTNDTWAAYSWFPIVNLYAPDGQIVATGNGPGKLTLKCAVPAAQRGKLWSIGPIGRVSAPKVNATWNKPPRAPEEHFPAYFKLPAECPQYVSPRADLYFIPTQ